MTKRELAKWMKEAQAGTRRRKLEMAIVVVQLAGREILDGKVNHKKA